MLEKLRETLKDYPEHIERLQEVLATIKPDPNPMQFDEAIWAFLLLRNAGSSTIQRFTQLYMGDKSR